MKVLHVIDALGVGGGAEHSLAAMLPKLRERGIDSSVITLISRQGGLGQRLRDEGFEVDVLAATSWPSRIRELRARTADASPDLVHATLFKATMAARFAGIRSGIPLLNSLVNTTYDPVRLNMVDIVPWKMTIMRTIDGFTARHMVTHFHALTEAVKSEATDVLEVAPEKVTVIPRGRSRADLGEATPERRSRTRARLGIGPDTPVLLNVGRQDHQKSQSELIRAFAAVLDSHPDAMMLIAGREGDASPEISATLGEVDVGDSIRLLGHRTDVNDLYVAADIFVFPSRYEGLGCSIIEAMALRTPIIGSDAAAIAEVLNHGTFGSVVPRGNVAALSAAICDMLNDAGLRARVADAAASEFDGSYELEEVADRTSELYRRLHGATRGRRWRR